jgi:IS5 family transposase
VDSASCIVHTLIGTDGNVSDVTQAHALLHGDEVAALGGAGYQGVEKNTALLFTLFGFANLMLAGQRFNITETRSAS